MALANGNYLNLKGNYLFSEIAKRVAAFSEKHPEKRIVRMGIGDVTRPLVPSVISALHKAVDDMAKSETFKGYGPEQGYDFLKNAIIQHDYKKRGIDILPDEIFVSDGAKSDMGNIGDIFSNDNVVAITDPVYPVYLDTNVMAGRQVRFLNGNEENGFAPPPPDFRADIIYLCSPNNPTGSVMSRERLAAWVDYAQKNEAVILFDAAYEAFISDPELLHSIYEIEGARSVAIEFRSLSKTAGFTGLRCGFCVVPKELRAKCAIGDIVSLNAFWNRRHTTKFNGTAYIVQRAAEAVYTPDGQSEIRGNIAYYMKNAEIIKKTLQKLGFTYIGGDNAPYIWLKCPKGLKSWDFFDILLTRACVVGTPGVGFGSCGEGWFRLSAFGNREDTEEAMERFSKLL